MARRARVVLGLSLALTALLLVAPYGWVIGYPLLLVSTLAHELGHGLAAILVGADFDALRMWPDGSGAATWSGRVGRLGMAAVAMGGLVGPAVAGWAAFVLGRRPASARSCLAAAAGLLLVLDLLRVRNLFGLVFVAALAAIFLGIALRASAAVSQLAVVFLAVQLALSVYTRSDYLFTPVAHTAGGDLPSDVAQVAAALLLPYWFWGGLCGAFSAIALWAGMRSFLRASDTGR